MLTKKRKPENPDPPVTVFNRPSDHKSPAAESHRNTIQHSPVTALSTQPN